MLRRESYGASKEMAADPPMMHNSFINTLGVSWPNGANTAGGLRESAYKIDVDRELMMSAPPPPNVRACTLPLLGRVQVISVLKM